MMFIIIATLRHDLCFNICKSCPNPVEPLQNRDAVMEEKLISLAIAMIGALVIMTGLVNYVDGWF